MKKTLLTVIFLLVCSVAANEMPNMLNKNLPLKIEIQSKKQYDTVEYCFKTYYGTPILENKLKQVNDLKYLHPVFREKINELRRICLNKGIEFDIVETYRTPELQNKYLHKKGKRVTRLKGGDSKHQYGMAVDIVPVINCKQRWGKNKQWKQIGEVGEDLGLIWGGRWRSPHDPGHFEFKVDVEDLKNGVYPEKDTLMIIALN